MNIINEFRDVVQDPATYALDLKQKKNSSILGYFCSYTPEEIIYAAGFHPMRLFGTKGAVALADAHLQAYSCSLVRGALEDALSGKLSYLDGAVFPHTCDSIQRLSDIWRLNTSFRIHADVVMPVKLDTASARKYMVDVLGLFRKDLEKDLKKSISDEDLAESIRMYNSIRKLLNRIYSINSNNPEKFEPGDLYYCVKASMIMERPVFEQKLGELVADLEQADAAAETGKSRRLVLSGGICDHPDIYRFIENAGGVVVWDDLCTGSRYFEGIISEKGDPIESIAARYTDRIICPAKHFSLNGRGKNLVEITRANNASGVIFLFLKFCDPHSFDYPYIKELLDAEGIPSMLLEIEQDLPSEGQLSTRLEAFIEMLG